MTISSALSFSQIDSLDLMGIREMASLFGEAIFDSDKGFGFSNTEVYRRYLTSTLIRQTPVFLSQLDTSTGAFGQQKFFLYSNIKFGIDFEMAVLDVKGPLGNAAKVRSILRQVFERGINISASFISLNDFAEKLEQHSVKTVVESLTVENFRHGSGMIGKYILRTIESTLALDVMKAYTTDVTRISFDVLASPVGAFSLEIARTGSLKVICQENELDDITNFLKQIMFN